MEDVSEFMRLLREWIKAEIDIKIIESQCDEEGYRQTASRKDVEDTEDLFQKIYDGFLELSVK